MTQARPAALKYAEGVLRKHNPVPAGPWVRLACQRFLRDLDEGGERGLEFDPDAAAHVVEFFSHLRHSKGEWAGQVFVLAPWQEFIVWNAFGWKRSADKLRRFRTIYIEVPKKNGKSTFAAGIGIFLFFADGEPGAEVYNAATKREQARIVHSEAVRMVKSSPALRKRIGIVRDNLHIEGTASKYQPLGADADTADGLHPHGVIIDELHAHKNRELYDVLETATAARRQPILFIITTAGYDRQTVCWELHDYVQKILESSVEDDTTFGYIATIDKADDWRQVSSWKKANPNLDVSVKREDLERKARKAIEVPSAQNAFLRFHLDVWTEQAERWLDMAVWRRCGGAVDAEALAGRECFAGLDLSATIDLTALELVFPVDANVADVLSFFWVPEESARQRTRRDRVLYDTWISQGHIEATEGDVVDYDVVRRRINELGERYNIREIALDPWNGRQLATQLGGDGFEVVEIRQGFASLTSPTKALETLLRKGQLRHGDNPVLTWMASNVAVETDAAGNIKPSKKRSTEKIDGIVALIMAVGRMGVAESKVSVYEDRGIFTI